STSHLPPPTSHDLLTPPYPPSHYPQKNLHITSASSIQGVRGQAKSLLSVTTTPPPPPVILPSSGACCAAAYRSSYPSLPFPDPSPWRLPPRPYMRPAATLVTTGRQCPAPPLFCRSTAPRLLWFVDLLPRATSPHAPLPARPWWPGRILCRPS
uniref:Uncharacterized protein n=3 Tax=Aegilops tauschii subsp. strangulata TaxID=200361 RepID=A0A453IAF9_AEGTS